MCTGQSQPDFLCFKGLTTSIWGKASLGATWCQGSLKGAGPKFWQDGGDDDSIETLTNNYDSISLAVSSCKDWMNICTVFVHRWPRLLHAFVTVDSRYFSGNRNFRAHINFCQLSYSATRFNFLPNLSLEHILFWSTRHAKKRKLYKIVMHHAWFQMTSFRRLSFFGSAIRHERLKCLQVFCWWFSRWHPCINWHIC